MVPMFPMNLGKEGLAEASSQRSRGPGGARTEAAIQGKKATYTHVRRWRHVKPLLGG